MMQNKQVRLFLSFLIAIATWIYVVYSVDPAPTKVFRDGPIRFINESTLTDNGLALRSAETTAIDVTVEANRSVLSEITADNIIVTVDLSSAGKGENTLDLEVLAPNNSTIQSQSEQRILVDVEDEVEVERSARVEYADPAAEAGEPYVEEQSEVSFTGYGAE